MRRVIFLRTAPYLYQLPGESLYESLDQIGLQEAQPNILKPSPETRETIGLISRRVRSKRVLCSRLARSQETARLFSADIIIASELDEIKFSMKDFSKPDDLPGDDLDPERINKIRYNFSRALICDQLNESREPIIERMLRFKDLIERNVASETILCFSHGFIMKLYENFFRLNCQISDFEAVVSLYDWKKPPFKFLDGFVVLWQSGRFRVIDKWIS